MCDSSPIFPTEINAMGQPCPMPLLMLKRSLKQVSSSHSLFLLKSSDPHSQIDVLRYCELHQLKCDMTQISAHEFHYLIQS
ncbi:sulfurtransferase TusA family protein [Acinetobacter ihumii]|uniref:sulfurtransferase TusA family protein n=1 Tax=Acinetobacter ihumii TaxID=2483802 RepID=UPI00102FC904|nr:sulfurtransferase TusA family protein [Acinetobacter ihumii]